MTPFVLLLGVSYWYYKELQSIKNLWLGTGFNIKIAIDWF